MASSTSFGSSSSTGSSGCAHGLSGEPSGLYAVTERPFSLAKSASLAWPKYGWHSTWLVAGFTSHLARMSSICSELKLDRPTSRTRPFLTSFSTDRYVSVGLTELSY